MWLKFAQDDIYDVEFNKAKSIIDSAIEKYYSLDPTLSVEELNDRASKILSVSLHIYKSLKAKFPKNYELYKLFSDANRAEKEMRDEATTRSGRTIYHPNSPENILQVIQEKIKFGDLNPNDIRLLLQDIESLTGGIPTGEYSYGRKLTTPLTPEQKAILDTAKELINRANMMQSKIDTSKLDLKYWKSYDNNTFIKQIDGNHILSSDTYDDNEYPILTFSIDKENGISLYAEVGDVDSEGAQKSLEFQKSEIQKFFEEVNIAFPDDWNKQINEIGDEGDIKRILNGELDKPVRIYRMMSYKEYNSWEMGTIVPSGKFFATKRHNAVGTDFGDEGERGVFSFIGNNGDFRGDFDGNLVSIAPLKLNGNRLIRE